MIFGLFVAYGARIISLMSTTGSSVGVYVYSRTENAYRYSSWSNNIITRRVMYVVIESNARRPCPCPCTSTRQCTPWTTTKSFVKTLSLRVIRENAIWKIKFRRDDFGGMSRVLTYTMCILWSCTYSRCLPSLAPRDSRTARAGAYRAPWRPIRLAHGGVVRFLFGFESNARRTVVYFTGLVLEKSQSCDLKRGVLFYFSIP